MTYPFRQDKIRDVIEKANGTPVRLKWEYKYDNYGNITRQVEHGRMDEGWDDERVTETAYTANYASGQSAWILREPVEQTITDESGTQASHSRNYYDNNTALGEVSKGNLTKIEDWESQNKYVISVRNDYDAYGNVVAIYDPLYGAKAGHYRELVYDSTLHAYPEKEIIHTGNDGLPELTYVAGYDYGFGVVTATTDFNEFTTTYGYDEFGRLTAIIKPPDSGHTVKYEYVLAHVLGDGRMLNWVETRQRDDSPGDGFLRSRSFQDGLGRTLMVRAEGENPAQIVVSDAVLFNARQQPWKNYLPYFDTGSLGYEDPVLTAPFTEHYYDALGRTIRVNQPAVSGQVVFTTIEYPPLARTIQDEEQTNPDSPHFGAGMRYVQDGLLDQNGEGRVREFYEIVKLTDTGEPTEAPAQWRTTYAWDVLDNLRAYADSQGNKRSFDYDGLSRKTFRNDPDAGVMAYQYDDASNLFETQDAKGQTIRYTYDGVNRLLTEDYLDEGLSFSAQRSPDVRYAYDWPAGPIELGDGTEAVPANTKGRLAWVRDLSGEEHTAYDARGRVDWVVKRIKNPVTGHPIAYKTGMSYDSMDRVRSLIYPDNDRLNYNYDTRGLLEGVDGGPGVTVVANLDYNASGQLTVYELGNGVTTSREYDPRLRLERLETHGGEAPSESLLAYGYTYDGVSNIKRIDDRRLSSVVAAGDSRRNTQIFTYDDLYRLTGVTYSYNAPDELDRNDGSIAYRYDRIGNLLSKTSDITHTQDGESLTNIGQMHYGGSAGRFNREGRLPEDSPGPHALTATDNGTEIRNIPYDANGNISAIDGKTLTWDFKDRLVGVETDAMHAHYVYDYTDRRVVKTVTTEGAESPGTTEPGQSATIYVDQYFEVRDDQPVKYVYAGIRRVARVTGTLNAEARRIQRLKLASGWNLVGIAVQSDSGLSGVEGLGKACRWDPQAKIWVAYSMVSPLQAGDILLLQSDAPALMNLVGTHAEAILPEFLEKGGVYLSGGLQSLSVQVPLPEGASMLFYDTSSGRWRIRVGGAQSQDSDRPQIIPAGQAMFIRVDEPQSTWFADSSGDFLYYHADHLGSMSVVTDALGALREERTFYPFGETRIEADQSRFDTAYKYNDKERDIESRLYYYGARYYDPSLGRWTSPDPLFLDLPEKCIESLAECNLYAYALNNPLSFTDPTGKAAANQIRRFFKGQERAAEANAEYYIGKGDYVRGGVWLLEAALNTFAKNVTPTDEEVAASGPAAPAAGLVGRGLPVLTRGVKSRIGPFLSRSFSRVKKFATKSVGNFTRKISPSDLGVKGNLKELRGSFGVNDGVATARIDMIRGKIKNPLEIVNNLANTARSSGANTLRIEGTLANERLYNVLSRRYGLTSEGATDVITIPLR